MIISDVQLNNTLAFSPSFHLRQYSSSSTLPLSILLLNPLLIQPISRLFGLRLLHLRASAAAILLVV